MPLHFASCRRLSVFMALAAFACAVCPNGPAITRGEPPATAAPAGHARFDDAQSFGGFAVLGATQTGMTLFMRLPNTRTLESALTQTADELGKVFDARPALSGAFADAKARNKGGVSLAAKLKGRDVHGVIFCGLDPGGGSATVIIAAADASKEDLAALLASMPAPLKMQTHQFPDGSGSIDLPEGWTTPSRSAAHGIAAIGPGGQVILFCDIAGINYPDSRIVRISRQTYQMALGTYQRQLQMYQQGLEFRKRNPNILAVSEPKKPVAADPDPNIQFPFMNFCRYCDGAEEVLKYWYPIREEKQKRAGGIHTSLDKIIEVFPLEPNPLQPKSKAGLAYIALTDHDGDKLTPVRAVARIQTSPIVEGEIWQLSLCNMRAPDATFDRDLPVMNAVMNSIKLDMNVIGRETQAETDAALKLSAQMFEQIQKNGRTFQDQQAIRFNNHQRQMAAQQKARHDAASDFIEYIGGVRHVYDTRTGRMLDVDLFNSNAITNGLNEAAGDPHQFIQIPLRYER